MQQQSAVNFIQKNLFETPKWLLNKEILEKISAPTMDRITMIQDNMLGNLLGTGRMHRLIASNNRDGASYRIDEYLDDLKKGIWSELATHKTIDNYRRNLQKSFIERLGNIVSPPTGPSAASGMGGIVISFGPSMDVKKSDIISVAKGTLRSLKTEIQAALPGYADRMSRYHLQDVVERIERVLLVK
jgi:hypothetical protein